MNRGPWIPGALLCLCAGCGGASSDERAAESAVPEYCRAVAADDADALRRIMTPELFSQYERSAGALALGMRIAGGAKGLELLSVDGEEVDGDTAFVDTEIRHGEVVRFERVVLKRGEGAWKVAGKQ